MPSSRLWLTAAGTTAAVHVVQLQRLATCSVVPHNIEVGCFATLHLSQVQSREFPGAEDRVWGVHC